MAPQGGVSPKLSDAELLTLAVLKVLLGFEHEAHWVRHAREHLRPSVFLCAWPGWLQQAAPEVG